MESFVVRILPLGKKERTAPLEVITARLRHTRGSRPFRKQCLSFLTTFSQTAALAMETRITKLVDRAASVVTADSYRAEEGCASPRQTHV